MKIRILGNSIRLRLSQTDISVLHESKSVMENVEFAQRKFSYGIRVTSGEEITVAYEDDAILVNLPESLATPWLTTEQVGVEQVFSQVNAPDISVLLEKDFACLVPRPGEDDLYPNPQERN
jgi:hypothetical protein